MHDEMNSWVLWLIKDKEPIFIQELASKRTGKAHDLDVLLSALFCLY